MPSPLEFISLHVEDSNGTVLRVDPSNAFSSSAEHLTINRTPNIPNVKISFQMSQAPAALGSPFPGYQVTINPMYGEPHETIELFNPCVAKELSVPMRSKYYQVKLTHASDPSKNRVVSIAFTASCTHPNTVDEDGEFWGGASGSCCVQVERVCTTCRTVVSSYYDHRD